jgi:DNA-binding MarR family transcriptional regulator
LAVSVISATPKGLVQRVRDPEDRRGVRIRLTPAGLELIDDLMPKHVANERRLLAALSTDDRDTLTDLLRSLATGLGDTSLG